ncbi:hypothetical protein SAMN05216223_102474 [Actinacidiphila yanglinensis]|uniref:AAA family ATPase n=1 Tax=Actinacidiphila yanglinensis TaxID=310779 RepID=A0A1H5VYX3_9ACTN|nr:AAA family ATPase [Actinacidiphila yanglinensis]SEF91767.1 hypothetical protein SAMN05216223_102474 [Actinacidiphila yanglinensis]
MDHTERFDSVEGEDGRDGESRSGEERTGTGLPGSGVSPFGAVSGSSSAQRPAGAFDAFAAGAPGRGDRHSQEPSAQDAFPGPAVFQDPAAGDEDGLGLAAGAGAVARLRGADSFDAFGTGGSPQGSDGSAADEETDEATDAGEGGAEAGSGADGAEPSLGEDVDPFTPADPAPAADLVPFGGSAGDVAVYGGFDDGFGGGSGGGSGDAPAVDVSGPGGLAPADRDLSGGASSGGFDAFDAFGTASGAGGSGGRGSVGGIGGSGGGASQGGSFDAFAAGAVGGNDRLPELRPSSTPSLFDATAPVPRISRPARDPLAPEVGSGSGSSAKVERVVTDGYLLTVNHIDGTEVSVCPPEELRVPVRRTGEERAARTGAARPTPPPGPPGPELPLLEREEERERLIRLLARGRSIRVTGPSGAGRTALLESVANACGDMAPYGVLWLSGYHRTAADVLQDLYTVVYAGDGYRPSRAELPGLLGEIGAVVVVDDLEFGGAALEELLSVVPECAFLMSATPDVPAPAADSMVEEVFLAGLTRVASLDLLHFAAGRPLAEDEAAWAADLWFESEGLPLRFVQAGALLRQRDALAEPAGEVEAADIGWDDSVWEKGSPGAAGGIGGEQPESRRRTSTAPLPSLGESAAPAELLASRLSEAAREALAFAVALDGECPHPSHLPALVGDTHGDAALGELTSVGLAVPVAAHFRLSAGVVAQLTPSLAVDGELSDVQAHTAALHYAWWTGHPSVTPERATAESEAIIAAMAACRDGGHASAAVLLARTVAPAFAAALHWGAWERALRIGQEAARLTGEVAEEAYFLHELGVLALCTGNLDRARADLEASIALRAALADRQGTVVGRRTLALVADLEGPEVPDIPAALAEEPLALPGPLALPEPETVLISRAPVPLPAPAPAHSAPSARRLAVVGSRRNLVAAGTGVLIAAVVGTIVTLGATSGSNDTPDNQVKPIESVQQDPPDTTAPPSEDGTTSSPSAKPSSTSPSTTATTTATPSTSGTTATTAGGTATTPPTTPSTSSGGHHGGGGSHPTTKPPTKTPTTPPPTTPPPTTPPPTTPPPTTIPPSSSDTETASSPVISPATP